MARTDFLIALLLAANTLFWSSASAEPDPTTAATPASSATGAAPAFPSMNATDGGGVASGGVGSQDNGAAAGASGSSGSAFSLGKGGVIGISVGIAAAVIAIIVLWTLWYLTKKRQWNIRESIRRASRRLTGRRDTGPARSSRAANRRTAVMLKSPAAAKTPREVDLEKGDHNGKASSSKPQKGWLAREKERSRSSSRENEPKG